MRVIFFMDFAFLLAGCETAPRVVYVQTPCKEQTPPPAEKPLQAMRGKQGLPVDEVMLAALVEVENLTAREVLLDAAIAACKR